MPIELRRQYLQTIRERYKNAPKKQKNLILTEFCQNCNYSRKYAIRILNGQIEPRSKKPGPKPTYGPAEAEHLKALWEAMGYMCSKKIKAALPHWLPYYEGIDEKTKRSLLAMSASTIDRLLKPYRKMFERRGISTTVPAVKNKIPIRLIDSEIKHPGFLENDTVAHCGDSMAGKFIHTLTSTDLFSAWTENRALWTKESIRILSIFEDLEL